MTLKSIALPRLDGAADGWMPPTEHCPVSIGTRLIGDRWSLLVVREILVGSVRFNAIHRALPGMSRSLLSSRLRYLERIGVIERLADAGHPARSEYRLTRSGLALRPVLEALGAWTLDWQLPPKGDDQLNVSALMWHMFQGLDRSALPKTEMTIEFRFLRSSTASAWIHVGEHDSGACIGRRSETSTSRSSSNPPSSTSSGGANGRAPTRSPPAMSGFWDPPTSPVRTRRGSNRPSSPADRF